VIGITYQDAVDAYREWARNVMRNQLPMLAEGDGEPNPLVKLAHDSLLLYAGRVEKGLPLKGNELATAVTALGALRDIRKRAFDLTEAERQLEFSKSADTDTNEKEKSMNVSRLNDLAKLEEELDELAKRLKHTVTVTSSDGDYEDESSPSLDAQNSDTDNSDDEEDDDDLEKASINEYVRTNDSANRPGKLKSSDHDSFRTKTQAMVDNISATEGCSKTEALRRLRDRYPNIVAGNPVTKSAPAVTFEDHVAAEMRKGCSEQVAAQRVMNAFGNTLPRTDIKKAEIAAAALEDIADDIWANSDLDRCSALRKARLENKKLYKRAVR
jgi:hypothetical protein